MQRLLLALVLGAGLTVRGAAQQNLPVSDTPNHVTSFGPDELGDDVRYLISNWPYDFEIAVANVVDGPKCNQPGDEYDCEMQVQITELILGHVDQGHLDHATDWSHPVTLLYRHARHGENRSGAGLEIKNGDKVVVMLAPVISTVALPKAYMANRLDHFTNEFVESVRKSVADSLLAIARCQSKP
jgi:hypothetical protein